MPHIHDKIDFTVAIFVVQQAKVLRGETVDEPASFIRHRHGHKHNA